MCLELQTEGIVNVDLQLLKAVNKGHLKIVLINIIVIMISRINTLTNRWIKNIQFIVII